MDPVMFSTTVSTHNLWKDKNYAKPQKHAYTTAGHWNGHWYSMTRLGRVMAAESPHRTWPGGGE